MQEHEKWLRIAKEDLLAAKALIKIELYGSVSFHCQQSAEKSLKGYLAFKKQEIIKTHDLLKLLELCMVIDRSFETQLLVVNYLNPFSTKFRYPSEYDIPDLETVKNTIKYTEKILNFSLKKINEPETGQTSIFFIN
ncbi:MAG: HEPN-type nucleotidyltransferase, antibiotic resistance related protein [candidate division TM6 bacterium GW2011_GWF2_28_16]|nr:MAG: HEPN-type nucleotidyltransferase, antibiotic resistance related protein [candidate division TM6 bacterium GW2011_GWF2_28_16]